MKARAKQLILGLFAIIPPSHLFGSGLNLEFELVGQSGNSTLHRAEISGSNVEEFDTITIKDASVGGVDGVFSGFDLDFALIDRDGDYSTKADQVLPILELTKVTPGRVVNETSTRYIPTTTHPGILFGLGADGTLDNGVATLESGDGTYGEILDVDTSSGWISIGEQGAIDLKFPLTPIEPEGKVFLFLGEVGNGLGDKLIEGTIAKSSPNPPPFTTFTIEDSLIDWGKSVAAVGDVNNDGTPDFAGSGSKENIGIVGVFSGTNAVLFYTIQSVNSGAGFAEHRNLVGLGDLDGDGAGEIAVGIPGGTNIDPTGWFEIYSGRDGSFLRAHSGEGPDSLGHEIANLGDVDGDGVSDYAASNFETGDAGGKVAVFSGATGVEIARITSRHMLRFASIAGPGDLDQDGRGDLALTLFSEFDPWQAGQVRVLSGGLFGDSLNPVGSLDVLSDAVRQQTLLILPGRDDVPAGFETLGLGLNGLGDIDGDGAPDLGAGTGPTDGAVVFSGATGRRIHEWTSDQLNLLQFVVETEGIGDLDGDTVPDVAVGRTGRVTVMSGKDGSLLAEMTGNGDMGEEIAAIGDLDGDGVSEVLASAPTGGYAMLISFSLGRGPVPDTSTGLAFRRQGRRSVVTWKAALEGVRLEHSSNLIDWLPVEDVLFNNLYVIPKRGERRGFYRLQSDGTTSD